MGRDESIIRRTVDISQSTLLLIFVIHKAILSRLSADCYFSARRLWRRSGAAAPTALSAQKVRMHQNGIRPEVGQQRRLFKGAQAYRAGCGGRGDAQAQAVRCARSSWPVMGRACQLDAGWGRRAGRRGDPRALHATMGRHAVTLRRGDQSMEGAVTTRRPPVSARTSRLPAPRQPELSKM